MEPGLILALLLWFAMAAIITSTVRKEWLGTWQGHSILVRNYLLTEQLFIDGKLVASTPPGPRGGSQLTGSIHTTQGEVPVLATLTVGLGRLDVQLFVDGKVIATTKGKLGTLGAAGDAVPAIRSAAGAVPVDVRWDAINKLLTSIRMHPDQPDLHALCDQTSDRLREILLDMENLNEAADAHRVLGGAEHTENTMEEIERAYEDQEAQARELVAAVQSLHLSLLKGSQGDEVHGKDLLQRLSAQVETEDAVGSARSRAARESAAQLKRARPTRRTQKA